MSRFSIPVHRQTHWTLIGEYKSSHRLHLSVVSQHMRRKSLKGLKLRLTLIVKARCGSIGSNGLVHVLSLSIVGLRCQSEAVDDVLTVVSFPSDDTTHQPSSTQDKTPLSFDSPEISSIV